MKKLFLTLFVLGVIAIAVSLLPILGSAATIGTKATSVAYDVATDGRTFVVNKMDPAAGAIKRGDTYVLNGTIFPGGAIPVGGTKTAPSSIGPDSAGSIGTWFCRGTFLVNGDQFSTQKIQRATTQYFAFSDKNRLITEGFEGTVLINRAIVGGIGTFTGARGLVSMERIGVNATGSQNLRFVFNIE
jgi:hypothetical protein